MNYFTSDTHFEDNRFDIMCRPFKNMKEYNECIIHNWNQKVSKKDNIFIIGDVFYKKLNLPILNKLNGRKILVCGNHDEDFRTDLEKYFELITDNVKIKIKSYDNLTLNLNHYPTRGCTKSFNLCGHVHGLWRVQKNTINVSVDVWGYSPVSLEKIKDTIKAINEYYDDDAWAAYSKVNTVHMGRGKKGSYYN